MDPTEFRTGVIKPVECVKEGWELIKADYWLMFAITLVGMVIGTATLYIALGAMVCGIFYAYLGKVDGRAVTIDDLWKGKEHFGSGLVVTLLIVVPMLFVYGIIYLPLIWAATRGIEMTEDELWTMIGGSFVLDLVFVVAMVCFHTLLMFAFPLIVDRKLTAMRAVVTSAKAVLRNLRGVTGLFVVNFGLTILGMLVFCVGIYLVMPVLIAGNAVAYRKVFPRLEA